MLESRRREFRVPDRVLDILVPEVGLQRPGIDALVRQVEPARVPKHVGMDRKGELGGNAKPPDQLAESGGGERCAPL
jgi:hypothetical protein